MEPAPRRVEVDQRGRVNLGSAAAGKTFRMTVRGDGTILLEPARVMTEAEIRALSGDRPRRRLSEELAEHGDPPT
jgi:hypothetical protein